MYNRQEIYSHPDKLKLVTDLLRKQAKLAVERLQADIDIEAKRGNCRRVDAFMLLIDIVSLNIFALLAYPVVERVWPERAADRKAFIELRKKENIETIMLKLKP